MTAFRPFARPFIKVFLGALFTYQVIYWAWFKLETEEKKLLKNREFVFYSDLSCWDFGIRLSVSPTQRIVAFGKE
jgi:hypothetical protein